jgi:hypothetical protein
MTAAQEPVYRSTAVVALNPYGLENGRAPTLNMGTEKELAQSVVVADIAAAALSVDTRDALASLSVAVPPDTTVLRISYDSSSPVDARRRAAAFADAYVEYRNRQATSDASASSAARPVKAASVITPAETPSRAIKPDWLLNTLVAVGLGAALGVGAAALAERSATWRRTQGADGAEPGSSAFAGGSPATTAEHTTAENRSARTQSELVSAMIDRGKAVILVTSSGGQRSSDVARDITGALSLPGRTVAQVSVAVGEQRQAAALRAERAVRALPSRAVPDPTMSTEQYVGAVRALQAVTDFVVIDAPGALDVPAATALAAIADFSVLVVRAEDAQHGSAMAAESALNEACADVRHIAV